MSESLTVKFMSQDGIVIVQGAVVDSCPSDACYGHVTVSVRSALGARPVMVGCTSMYKSIIVENSSGATSHVFSPSKVIQAINVDPNAVSDAVDELRRMPYWCPDLVYVHWPVVDGYMSNLDGLDKHCVLTFLEALMTYRAPIEDRPALLDYDTRPTIPAVLKKIGVSNFEPFNYLNKLHITVAGKRGLANRIAKEIYAPVVVLSNDEIKLTIQSPGAVNYHKGCWVVGEDICDHHVDYIVEQEAMPSRHVEDIEALRDKYFPVG